MRPSLAYRAQLMRASTAKLSTHHRRTHHSGDLTKKGPPPSGTRLLGKALRSFCAQGPLPAGTRLPGQRLRGSCAPVRYLVKLDFQNMRSVDLAVQYSRYDPGWLAVAAGDRGRRGGGGRGRRGKQSGRRGRGFVLGEYNPR
nr:uncharacterized protein LOC124223280 [Neodiprion pinetum]